MRYLSVCSGIEAASVAWEPLGWECAAMSEIEKFPRAVLSHRYPDVPLHGDFTTIKENEYGPIDLLVGGTPCQSFSVAGLRGGMADDRGNLALEFCRLALRTQPRWIVWENVPGVLSSNEGRDFGAFLGALAQCGYGFAYRVLDAQFVRVESHPYAVPQRRRRVFVVGCLGSWRRAAQVLFERERMCGHPPPRRESGQSVAGTISSRTKGGGGLGTDFEIGGGLVAAQCNGSNVNPVGTLRSGNGNETGGIPFVAAPVRTRPYGDNASQESQLICMSTGQANAEICEGISPTLNVNRDGSPIAFDTTQITSPTNQSVPGPVCHTLAKGQHAPAVVASAVRRLTPLECERLQGFPDDWTNVPYRGKPACDGPRYKAIGNSMAVNVMSWIGQRLQTVERSVKQ